jgi:hypothetical protein
VVPTPLLLSGLFFGYLTERPCAIPKSLLGFSRSCGYRSAQERAAAPRRGHRVKC